VSTNLENLVEELRLAYNDILDLRKHLDNKASTMIATSGTVSSLLFGFGTFTLTKINPTYPLLFHASVALIAAVIVTIASALVSLRAFKTEEYKYVMSHSRFFLKDAFNEEVIRGYQDSEPEEFRKTMIRDYLKCNLMNSNYNNNKVKKITLAQRLLLVGVFLIPVILVILVEASVSKAIH
jgi:hypothetical protein